MRVVGLVGGIGSGKSTAAGMLGELGALVIDADRVGHEVYRRGTPGFEAVVAEFGRGVVGEDGEIDRRRLGPIVFASPDRLAALNRIVHPLIRAEIARRIDGARREGRHRAVVVEAAILLEAGWRDLVDEVWVVSAGSGDVVDRLSRQRGLDPTDTAARVARQMPDAERRRLADRVIENRGTLDDLRTEVGRAWLTVAGDG